MCRSKGHSGPGIGVISDSHPHTTAWLLHPCPLSAQMPQTGALGERENSLQHKALCNFCKDLHKRSSSDTNNSLEIITLKANSTHKMHYHNPALSSKQEAILCWSTSSLNQQFGACFPIMMSNQLLSLKSFSAKFWIFHLKIQIIFTSQKMLK